MSGTYLNGVVGDGPESALLFVTQYTPSAVGAMSCAVPVLTIVRIEQVPDEGLVGETTWRGMVVVVTVTGILGLEAGPPLDFDDGSALNPKTSTTARTAMTESHAQAGRREDAGLILIHRNPPGRRRLRRILLLALIEAMAIASSAETADESSGNSARIWSGRSRLRPSSRS